MNEEKRIIGYCEVCGEEITDDTEAAYVDGEGHYFDTIECVLEYFDVSKVEL